jgi:Ser/Thr protein kinase RdoA (MazF antagonist)
MSSSDSDRWFDAFREGLRRDEAERAGDEPAAPSAAGGLPDLPRYAIGERLGEGGAAVVYRAWDRELGRPVALKLLRDTADVQRTLRARFHREAKTAAVLNHPNVVRVYDLGEAEGRLYMVMELVEGSPLGALLSAGAMPLEAKLRLLEKAARGVAQAHAQGIVHRDLKPANILVDRAGEPKVGDFGISVGLDAEPRLTQTGESLGTPAYMAPEQVRGAADPTVRTDVYALGAILYEMLTGRPPHTGGTIPELFHHILERDPELPHDVRPDAPKSAGAIAMKALSKDPAGRYADAGAFADDLGRFLRGEPVLARNPGPLRRLAARLRARPPAAALLAGAAAAALVVLAAALSPKTADTRRAALSAAAARAFEEETTRLDERYKGLQPVRLVAALQAASERGADATPPEEIRELLDYELKKLRIEPDLLAVIPPAGKPVYARGPAGALASLESRRPEPGVAFTAVDGRLWLLEGTEVRDPAPEADSTLRGYRWIGAPLDSAGLERRIDAEAGLVAWTGPDGRVLAGPISPGPFVPGHRLGIGDRVLEVDPQPLAGSLLPIRQVLLVDPLGTREVVLLAGRLAAAVLLAGGVLLLARPR